MIRTPMDEAAQPATVSSAWIVYVTALLEGASVIVVEIAGARALAPFFGTSLQVWTAQITVTLFFLAAGYGVGGLLAKSLRPTTLPMLFAIAGFMLALYPVMRGPILDASSANLGVAFGSLISASILFGPTLLALGAVSPVLIAYIDRRRPGAGSAAGRLFFTNTMGGLAGGWLTAFVLIPHMSLRIALVTTGVVLLLIAAVWLFAGRSNASAVVVVPALLIAGYILFFSQPERVFKEKHGMSFEMKYSHQSGIGLLQVLEFADSRALLINGVLQGQLDLSSDFHGARSEYIHSMDILARSHHPTARTALQLGLGAGLLPKELDHRGVKVKTIEIEPQIVKLARDYFELPQSVEVITADARSFLRHDTGKYDLIFLDTFASESTPWHILTVEAMAEIKARLNPGGRLIINTVSFPDPKKAALDGIEASVLSAFPEEIVYASPPETNDPEELVNVLIVAGENLHADPKVDPNPIHSAHLAKLLALARPGTRTATPCTDDRSNLDYAQASMRVHWREAIWQTQSSNLLSD